MATTFKSLPVIKIFVDSAKELIFARTEEHPLGVRRDHEDGAGYQRDPWTRLSWIQKRADDFSEELCRPAEVSARGDGTYAIMDAGGRWVMKQLLGHTHMWCRVHENLTREEEAELFTGFDDTYKLRAIDTFLAMVGAADPVALAIVQAVQPYKIAVSGGGTLKSVPAFYNMYLAHGARYEKGLKLLDRTAKLAAIGWSGYTEGGATTGKPIDGKFLLGLGMVVDAATRLDQTALLKVLGKYTPDVLTKRIHKAYGDEIKTLPFTQYIAKDLARAYNRAAPERKVDLDSIDNCALWEHIQEGKNFAAMRRETQMEVAEAA